jgi:hypothetical protein
MIGSDNGKTLFHFPSKKGPEQAHSIVTEGLIQPVFVLDVQHFRFYVLHCPVHFLIPSGLICIDERVNVLFPSFSSIGMADNMNIVALFPQIMNELSGIGADTAETWWPARHPGNFHSVILPRLLNPRWFRVLRLNDKNNLLFNYFMHRKLLSLFFIRKIKPNKILLSAVIEASYNLQP